MCFVIIIVIIILILLYCTSTINTTHTMQDLFFDSWMAVWEAARINLRHTEETVLAELKAKFLQAKQELKITQEASEAESFEDIIISSDSLSRSSKSTVIAKMDSMVLAGASAGVGASITVMAHAHESHSQASILSRTRMRDSLHRRLSAFVAHADRRLKELEMTLAQVDLFFKNIIIILLLLLLFDEINILPLNKRYRHFFLAFYFN